MKSLVDELPVRLLKWIEIDYENGEGLFAQDMHQMAAREAAASLVYDWYSQFPILTTKVVVDDIDLVISELKGWKDSLVYRIKNHPEEF